MLHSVQNPLSVFGSFFSFSSACESPSKPTEEDLEVPGPLAIGDGQW